MRISTIFQPLLALTSVVSVIAASTNATSVAASATVETVSASAPAASPVAATAAAAIFAKKPPKWVLTPSEVSSKGSKLSQNQTNGNSKLGAKDAPQYAKFIGDSGQAAPWGGRTAKNTNQYQDVPNTGVTRHYDFTLARSTLAPDGVERPVILINGEFPGPTIEADWGDIIEVTVNNGILNEPEGTSLHWHGFIQNYTNFEDGVPGITQCPIAPGQSFTYSFQASLYGTSWYHSHFSAQYVGGTFGAIVVHGPTDNADYDIDLGPVLLTDSYYRGYYDILEDVMGTDSSKIIPSSDNNLINGKGITNCSFVDPRQPCTPDAALAQFTLQPGKTHRMRLVNSGAEAVQKFSIDNHKLTVFAVDFVPITPYETTVVTLGVGQRADVLITADSTDTTEFWMRSTISCASANQPNGLAIVSYNTTGTPTWKRADAPFANSTSTNTTSTNTTSALPTTSAWPDNTNPCANDDLTTTVPFYAIEPPSTPAVTTDININFSKNTSGHFVFSINNSSFRADYNEPILQAIQAGKVTTDFPAERNIFNFSSASSIRIVVNNLTPAPHPMHIHGHNMYVLAAESTNPWDGNVVNPSNPTRRDTQLLEPNGSIVIQIDADNPGVWPFHCHIAWHVSAGLYVNILERPDDIVSNIQNPDKMQQVCDGWSQWTSDNYVDQIDSGLRMMEKARLRERDALRRSIGRRF